MPKNPFAKSQRSSRGRYSEESDRPPRMPREQETPLAALRTLGDKLRPHTAVTSTERPPGADDDDQYAGTSVPVAARANKDAPGQGAREYSEDSTSTYSHQQHPQHRQFNEGTPNGYNSSADRKRDGEPSVEQRAQYQSHRSQKVLRQGAQEDYSRPREDGGKDHSGSVGRTSSQYADTTGARDSGNDFDFADARSSPVRGGHGAPAGGYASPRRAVSGNQHLSPSDRRSDPQAQGTATASTTASITTAPSQADTSYRSLPQQQQQPKGHDASYDDDFASAHSTNENGVPAVAGEDPALDDDDLDSKSTHSSLKVPDTVPGLEIGQSDPGLPGQRKKADKPKGIATSDDLPEKDYEKKYGTVEQRLEEFRAHQSDYVGWREVGGWDARFQVTRQEAADLLQRSTLLEEYVSDKYLGDWYQNTALIITTAFFAWLVGRLGFGLSSLSIILLFTATAYRTSVRRMRRNYRDDIVRDVSVSRLDGDKETMEWLNSFLVKFWLIYEPSLAEMITNIANDILKEQTPPFIESLTLDKFTLGTKAPRIEFVRSFPKTDPSVAVMDWSVSFTPNDTMDLTARQLKSKVNPKIVLGIKIGKGIVSKKLPVLMEDMSFAGTARLRIKMMNKFPHIQTVDVSFLQPPKFDFVLKPIGGDTFGFDINVIPGLSKFIKDMVDANIGPMLYAPNAFQVNVEELMAGVGIMSGVGILSVKVIKAEGLRADRAAGTCDPFVKVLNPSKVELAQTKIKVGTTSPTWDETLHCIVTNLSETILLEVLDFDEKHVNRTIGILPVELDKVVESGDSAPQTAVITSGGAPSGKLTYSVIYSPVQMPVKDADGDDQDSAGDSKSGILNFTVVGGANFNPTLSKVGQLSTFCEVEIDGKLMYTTKVSKDSNNPNWGFNKEMIVFNKETCQVIFRIRDKRGSSNPQIAIAKMRLSHLLLENEKGNTWFPLEPQESGSIHLESQWKPVALADVPGSSYVEPVGVVRMNVLSATDLRNLEHVGKVDPYIRVFLNNRVVARTDWFQNTLNPKFDEYLNIPVQNELQTMTVEVMDVEKRGKDRSLGFFKVDLSNIMSQNDQGQYVPYKSDKKLTSRFVMPERGPKGTLTYELEFSPTIQVASPDELARIKAERKDIAELEAIQKPTSEDKEKLDLAKERLSLAGVDMPLAQQLSYSSGVVAVSFGDLTGATSGLRLRVTRDNIPHPIFVSGIVKSTNFIIGQSADYVSGQFPLSNIRIQLVDGKNVNDPKSTSGEVVLGVQGLLKEAFLEPKTYKISEKASISLSCRFFPLIDFHIAPQESISNSGCIEVQLDRAIEVEAADPNGTSDPYCAFYINDSKDKIYKSQIIKKTLDPVWNEHFRFDIADVKSTLLKALVYDWDMGNNDDYLGGAEFDCSYLLPLEWKEYKVDLMSVKKGKTEEKKLKQRQGQIQLSLRYDPGIVQKVNNEDVLGIKSVTKTAGAGLGVAAGAAGAAGGLALGGAGHVGNAGSKVLGIFGHHGDNEGRDETEMENYTVSVESLKGLQDVPNVQLRIFTVAGKEKEVYKSKTTKVEGNEVVFENAVFELKAGADDQLGLKLREVKGLGRHSDIGQATTSLSPGEHTVDFGGGLFANLSVTNA